MNSIKSIFYLTVASSALILGCRKDPKIEEPVQGNCYCCEQIEATDTIKFGVLDNMNILYPDTLIKLVEAYGSGVQYYELDIDQDGINDLKFTKEFVGSYTTGYSPRTKIEVLSEETWIAVSEIPDTLYYFETDVYHNTVPVVQSHYFKKSCLANSSTDSILSTSNYVEYFQFHDEIFHSTNWSANGKILQHNNANFQIDQDLTNPDTIIDYYSYYYYGCHDLPVNTSTYIGIKKYYCGEQKLGWIRLKIGYYELRVEEIAIQK